MARLWIIVSALLSLGILILGWFLGAAPKLNEIGRANEQRATVETQNIMHEQRLTALKADFERLDELKAELAALHMQLPPGDDLSTFVGLLDQLEAQSGVTVTRISTSNAEPYVPADAAVKTNELVNANNFIVIPITISVEGTRNQVLNFVSVLQFGEQQRLYLVQDLTVSRSDGSGSGERYTGNINGYVFVLVDPSAPPPSPTRETPAETPTGEED